MQIFRTTTLLDSRDSDYRINPSRLFPFLNRGRVNVAEASTRAGNLTGLKASSGLGKGEALDNSFGC